MLHSQNQMGRHTNRREVLAIAAASGFAAGFGTLLNSREASAQPAEPLVGSWMSIYHRSTGEVLTGLVTFHEDGTVINSTSDYLTGGTSHGTWTAVGNGQYAYSVLRLDVDPSGNYTGIRTVDSDVTVDPSTNSWTSVSETNFFDTDGNLVRTLTTMGAANRVPVVRRTTRPTTFVSGG